MIQEAPTAPVVTPGVPAELSPAPVTDGKTTERETAPHQERYRPSGRLMWHIAHGEFNGGVYPTKTTSVVSEKSYQALQAQHEDVRKTDSFLRENRVKEWLRGKIPGIQDSDMTSQLLHHAEMEMWAKGEAQAVARMLAAGDSHTAEALQKLGFIIPDNTPDAHSDQALKDALYRSTSDQSGEYGSFYGAFCRSGMDTNKLLAQKLTEEEMDVIKPFLTDILGGETAFQALKALKQTQHAVAILPSEDQTKIYTDEPDFKNDNEQKVFNYFQKGSELAKKQPTPLPAPETVSQPEQNPTPPETTAIPQWPPLDYAKLADEVSLDKFSQNGSIRDLQDAVSNIQPVQLSHDISLEIIYDNLTNRNPPISSPDLEFDANDQAMREYQRYVDTKNQDRDPSQQIPINSTRHDPKSGTTEFFVDRTTIFPFHYVKPINQWADKSPLTRAYITIDPAHARYLYRDFVDLAYTLSDAGIEFEAKAIEPEKLGQRQESMTLYFPEGQQEKAGQIIQTYLTEHPGFAHGHLITALPDTVDGLSWAREPDTVQTNLVREITGTTEHSVSYNEFVSAMTLPFYLQRIEKMYRDAGKTADANIIHQEFERVHAVMQKYTPKQEAEQKLTNAETSREQPKTVEDIRREVFENAGRRSAEEVSQLIGDVQQILTQEKEAGRGKMKATIQEMNDSPDTNQTKPTREGEVVFLPKGAGRLVALGDIHGDLATIQQVLTKEHVLEDLAAGSPVQVVFMGDLVDRGPKDIEVMEAVMMLKKLYPDHITIMKADHEMTRDEINHHPITDHGFPTHLGNRFHQDGVRLNNELADLFDLSPRMVEGANGLRLVHGGPGMQPLNLQEYAHLSQEEVQRIFDREITWADPVSNGDRATNLKSQKEKMLGDLRKRIDTNDFSPYFEPPSNPTHGTSGAPVLTTPEEIKELYQLLSELPEGFYPNIERTSSKSILRALRHGRLAYTEEGLQAPLKTVGDRVILRAHQTSRQVSGGEDAIKFGGKLGSIHTTGKGSPESAYSGGEPHPRYAVFDLGKPITQISPDNIKDVWSAESTVRVSPESTEGQTPSPTPEKIKELGGNAYWYMRKKSREAPPAQEFSQAMFGVQGNEALMSAFGEISKDPNDIGRHFYGHGIAKESTTDQLQALINILQGDKAKGTSTTVTLSSNNTNYPVYSGGGFVIIGSKDKQLLKDDGTFAVNLVAVNEQFYDAIPTLHEWFPNVQFVKAEDLPEVLKKQVGESPSPETSSPTPEKIRELAHQAFEYMHNSQNNPPETGSVFEQMGDPGNRALGNAINKISADDGAHFESHGIARGTTREQLQALVNLLEGQGFSTIKSTTVPLSSDNSYQRPYTHGGFIIIGPKDTQMVGQNGTLNIKMVAVNKQFYHAIPTLQEWFPNVQFIKADDLPEVVEKLVHPSP